MNTVSPQTSAVTAAIVTVPGLGPEGSSPSRTSLPGPNSCPPAIPDLLVAANFELAAHLAAREVAGAGIGWRNAVVSVDVHVGIAAPNLPEGVGEIRDTARAHGAGGNSSDVQRCRTHNRTSAKTPSWRPVGPVSALVDVTLGNNQMKIQPFGALRAAMDVRLDRVVDIRGNQLVIEGEFILSNLENRCPCASESWGEGAGGVGVGS